MDVSIKKMDKIRLLGYKERVNKENGSNFRRIPAFWSECAADGRLKALQRYNDNPQLVSLGVCAHESETSFDYYIATGSKQVAQDPLLHTLIIPTTTYAIFESRGKIPEALQATWKRIFLDWLPSSSYVLQDGPQIEWYSLGDMATNDYESQVWIPVMKKRDNGLIEM